MKIFTCLMLAMCFLAQAQEKVAAPVAPQINVVAIHHVTVKEGHETAFKSALAFHAQKFHAGPWSWRVGAVLSGAAGNSYQIIEGPFSWTALDDRADPGNRVASDYETNVAPHIAQTTPTTYAIYEPGMSNAPAEQRESKVLIVSYSVKPGKGMLAADILKAYRAANTKRGFSFAVWHSIYSGDSVYYLVYRFPQGWKELDVERLGIREAFDEIGGPGEYVRQQAKVAEAFESIFSELIEYKTELGSK